MVELGLFMEGRRVSILLYSDTDILGTRDLLGLSDQGNMEERKDIDMD